MDELVAALDAALASAEARPEEWPDLRSAVEAARVRGDQTLVDQAARSGLIMAFNDLVPAGARLELAADKALTIRVGDSQPTSRDVNEVVGRIQRAIVAVSREIRQPAEAFTRLHTSDYEHAPLFVTTGPGNLITFRPAAGDLVMDELPAESLSAQALTRFANLLPGGADDNEAIEAALGGRTPTRRAMHEAALAAKRVHGIRVTLSGADDAVDGVLTQDQAEDLEQRLTESVTETVRLDLVGNLDGARSRRRIFYFESEGRHDIEGVIDEPLVGEVFGHLRESVRVIVEESRTRTVAGTAGRPVYRLVGLEVIPTLDGEG
ncbi:MAG TPA: hypothetical protein VFK41_01935 [Nocardioidaceae bacterium]|nr:hypothetical protein [Nocardioidaceae bacterium]